MNEDKQNTILLVEDDALIGMTESLKLEEYGYEVVHVLDGQKAIDYMNDGPLTIKIILMDIDLGTEIDGTDAAVTILKNHDLPILFLSSHIERSIV